MAIRGILFDKDGTIIDYWKTWVPINRQVTLFAAGGDQALADRLLAHGGQDPATDDVAPGSPFAAGSVEDIAGSLAEILRDRTPPRLAAEIDRIFREGGAKHSVLIAGARETLIELLRRGYRLGLATNDSDGGLEASVGPHGLLPLFDFLAGCDSGFGAKPAPGMVLGFCAAVGFAPCEVAVVGDAVHDLEMARVAGAGLKIGVLSGTSPREQLEPHADVLVESIAALPEHEALHALEL